MPPINPREALRGRTYTYDEAREIDASAQSWPTGEQPSWRDVTTGNRVIFAHAVAQPDRKTKCVPAKARRMVDRSQDWKRPQR